MSDDLGADGIAESGEGKRHVGMQTLHAERVALSCYTHGRARVIAGALSGPGRSQRVIHRTQLLGKVSIGCSPCGPARGRTVGLLG